jgi:hypothetical protein
MLARCRIGPEDVLLLVPGFLTGNKMLYEVLAAYRQVQPEAPRLRLVFAGEERPSEYDLSARIAAWWPGGDGPAVTGYLDAQTLDALLARADLSFVLRYPTYGESSGILPRAALGAGGCSRWTLAPIPSSFLPGHAAGRGAGPGGRPGPGHGRGGRARALAPGRAATPSGRRGASASRTDTRGPLPGLAGLARVLPCEGAAMSTVRDFGAGEDPARRLDAWLALRWRQHPAATVVLAHAQRRWWPLLESVATVAWLHPGDDPRGISTRHRGVAPPCVSVWP